MTDLLGRLPAADRRVIESISASAKRRNLAAYLVGGAVRDLASRRRPRDFDIAVEGDAVAFARIWAAESHRALEAPSLFGTVRTSGLEVAARVEFASARGESYAAPAALPKVFAASIDDDLKRRDFTVNAMALGISGARAGELIDPFGGMKDLRRRTLRILHPGSFSDDPTRAFRAVRYAVRLSFRIEAASLAAIERERRAGAFDALSGPRLRRELELILDECGPEGLRRLGKLKLTSVILPRLRVSPAALARLDRARTLSRGTPGIDGPRLLLLAWMSELSARSVIAVADRLDFRADSRRSFASIGEKRRMAAAGRAAKTSGEKLALDLRHWSSEETLAVASWLSPGKARRLHDAWRRARQMRLRITGDDLVRSGVAPGPAIGRAMEEVWKARLGGRIKARDELAFAVEQARR